MKLKSKVMLMLKGNAKRMSHAIAVGTIAIASMVTAPCALAVQAATAQDPSSQAHPATLPDVALVARDGSPASTAKSLLTSGHWLLIHVQKGSLPCEALLARMHGDTWTNVPPRVAIIVAGATAADVTKLAAQFPALEGASWFADEPGALATALRIDAAPTVVALNDRGIRWTLAGVLSGSKRLESALTGWVAPGATTTPPAAAAAKQ